MSVNEMVAGQDQRIAHAVEAEQARLKNFIRRRVPDARDVEHILQDVFYELVEAYRMMKPIEHVSAWLYRVARNRITDLFRRKRPETSTNEPAVGDPDDDETLRLEDLLPSPEAGPEAAYARGVLIEELDLALGELPVEQRQVFVAHEIEARSFKRFGAGNRVEREHADFAEALCGAASARAAGSNSR